MTPKVSICCLCYNQEAYIAQTLDSMLSQKCDFPFEILIHDDASTDNSAQIIKDYAARYPDIIKPILQTENQFSGPVKNISGLFNFPRAKGTYIAMCEGDDYWCDESKLARQAAYMDAHPDCSLCLHSAWQINSEIAVGQRIMRPYSSDRIISPPEIITKRCAYPTASLMMRTELMQLLPDFYMHAPIGDIPMQLTMALGGYAFYMDRPMCAYRYCAPGSWTQDMYSGDYIAKQKKYADDMARMYDEFDAYSEGRFHKEASEAKDRLWYMTRVNIRDWNVIFDRNYSRYRKELGLPDRIMLVFERAFPKVYRRLQIYARNKADRKRKAE